MSLLCDFRYGDRTPKSDPAKAFAIVWFLVGLVVFALFSSGLSSDLTLVVSKGGPEKAEKEGQVLNVSFQAFTLERFSFAFTANVKRQTAGCCLL